VKEEEEDTDDFYTFGRAVNLAAGDDVSNASEGTFVQRMQCSPVRADAYEYTRAHTQKNASSSRRPSCSC
jgi:hypothetical protein